MRIGPHHHPCARCKAKVECCGDIEQNHDGWPEWICREYHNQSGTIETVLCETCIEASCACGELATKEWDHGADYAFWTGQPQLERVCADCFEQRDNFEPPEPDGEAFRGNEAAAFQAEQLDAARRLK